jgi:hypothetical protein
MPHSVLFRCSTQTRALPLLCTVTTALTTQSVATIGILFDVYVDISQGKPKYSEKKPAPVPLCSPQIPHKITWARTLASAMGSRRLTA